MPRKDRNRDQVSPSGPSAIRWPAIFSNRPGVSEFPSRNRTRPADKLLAPHAFRKIMGATEAIRRVMVVGIPLSVADLLHQLGRSIEDMGGRCERAGRLGGASCSLAGLIGSIRFRRGGKIEYTLCQHKITLGRTNTLIGLPAGQSLRQCCGIGKADILRRKPGQPPQDVACILSADQHPRKPIECRIRVRAAQGFMQGADQIIMLFPVLVMTGARCCAVLANPVASSRVQAAAEKPLRPD